MINRRKNSGNPTVKKLRDMIIEKAVEFSDKMPEKMQRGSFVKSFPESGKETSRFFLKKGRSGIFLYSFSGTK